MNKNWEEEFADVFPPSERYHLETVASYFPIFATRVNNLEDWIIKFRELAKISPYAVSSFGINGIEFLAQIPDFDIAAFYDIGRKVIEQNKNAGEEFFSCGMGRLILLGKYDSLIDLIRNCSDSKDYDLLKYQFKLENSKFDEFNAVTYLLRNKLSTFKKEHHISNSLKNISALPKADGFILDYAIDALKIIDDLKLTDSDSMFNEITKRLNGMDLFRKFCGKLLPNKRNAVKRFDFDTMLDILRSAKVYKISPGNNNNALKSSPQNTCFRDYFVHCIRKFPLFENKKDKEVFEFLKKSYNNRSEDYKTSQLIRPLIKEITQFRTLNDASDDLLDELAGYFITPKKFNNIQLINATSQHFTHSLENNVELKSCAFGPNGSVREACLSYLCDPNVNLLFIETYFEDQIMENIGVIYLIDTKENVVVIDGVDGGLTMQHLNLNEAIYEELRRHKHELLRTKGSNLVLNTNIGKNKTTNNFLEYVCMKTGIKSHREEDRVYVDEKDKMKLHKPLLSESNPEAYKALGPNGNLSYLDAWRNSCGNIWNTGQGEVEYIELF